MSRATAAPANWPYRDHRTVADIDRLKHVIGKHVGFSNSWLPREDRMVRVGVEIGMTFEEIAACIPGRTRNACLGRAHRLGLSSPRALAA